MDKGIIIGLETELSVRTSLPFSTYKLQTSTHLFLPHLLKYHLSLGQIKAAVRFAAHFQKLSYFAHALEILLHGVLEQEADEGPGRSPRVVEGSDWEESKLSALSPIAGEFAEEDGEGQTEGTVTTKGEGLVVPTNGRTPPKREASEGQVAEGGAAKGAEMKGVLPLVVEFLDHFPQALDVVVGCARKTEVARWGFLFDVVGPPRDLFEVSHPSLFLLPSPVPFLHFLI